MNLASLKPSDKSIKKSKRIGRGNATGQGRTAGKGHKGFSFQTGPKISLEEDLKRRDITINAIAKSKSGDIIDPFGGIDDIKRK